jgi:hypothetical protein
MKRKEITTMSKTQTYATVKFYQHGKIVGEKKLILPGKLTKQEVKAIVTDQYDYEVIRVPHCICQTPK